jgi:class 3 adenylate cyclase/tetratricopeptide (TPR) repeat protein
VDELERWLAPLGLVQLAPALRANDIDLNILPELSEADLEKIGLSLGQRKKLLRAAACLTQPSSLASPTATPSLSAVSSAERRQLTVMFCDLVGSTALSTRLDPEDLREVIGAYQDCCAQVIARFDGNVARYLGDGALVYFGYPQAHEDDAERAVRAGLGLVEAVSQLRPGHDLILEVRVGIATGLVVIGDIIGLGAVWEEAVIGETPNLAARLQASAEPNTVVIAPNTRRLLGGLFDYAELGELALKGFAAPVKAWQVISESTAVSRFEARRTAGLTPLVGREQELALLLRCWERARSGEGQIVLLAGEPGVGKSRVTQALGERLNDEPQTRLSYYGSPYYRDSALHPIIDQLERASGFARNDPPERRLAKLETLLAQSTESVAEVMPLFAPLLSIPSNRYPPLNMTPQRRKEKTLEALAEQLAGLASRQPVLMIFEDAHWIDPTSIELLGLTIDRLRCLSVLLVITFRPEFTPPWTGQPHVTSLTLDRLNQDQVAAMVERLTDGKALPAEILNEIVARTDGVPLFVEELTKTVLESELFEDRGDRYELTGPLPPLAIPATLQDSLMARLDRLAPIKEVAQIGAALGREFSYELLAAVARRSDVQLTKALDQLAAAGLIIRRGTPPRASFMFKHALVQDAAYGALLRSQRHELHSRIADVLRATTGEAPTAPSEIIAHHLQSAGRSREAVDYWREAGERAAHRAANREAIGHFRRALSLLEAQPETSNRMRAEVAILSRLCPALMNIHGWSAPEVGAAVEQTAEIARRLGNSAEIAPSIANLWIFHANRGQFDRADEISANLFKIASECDDPDILLQAHHTAWPLRWARGLFVAATQHTDAGLALYDQARHSRHGHTYIGHDPEACALGVSAAAQSMLGYPARAMCREGEALTLPRRLRHPPSLAQALMYVCDSRAARGDAVGVLGPATELLEISIENSIPQHRGNALVFLGWARASCGETSEGIAQIVEGLGIWNQTGWRAFLTRSRYLMSERIRAGCPGARPCRRNWGAVLCFAAAPAAGRASAACEGRWRRDGRKKLAPGARRRSAAGREGMGARCCDEPRPAVGRAGPTCRSA